MIEKQNTKDIFISCCFLCAVGDFRVNTHLIKNTKAATFTGQGVPRATGHRESFFFFLNFVAGHFSRLSLWAPVGPSHLRLDEKKDFFSLMVNLGVH